MTKLNKTKKLTTFCENFSKDVLRSIDCPDLHEWDWVRQRNIERKKKKEEARKMAEKKKKKQDGEMMQHYVQRGQKRSEICRKVFCYRID